MVSTIDPTKVKVEKLSKIHNTSNFDCGDEDINDFLRNDALMWQSKNLAITHIFIYNEEIIGFYCSSADSIKLDNNEKKQEDKLDHKHIREVPAIKIGRLGRSVSYKKQKLGEFILRWAIGYIRKLSEETGIRFITVDSYPCRVPWYESFGFRKNLHEEYKDKRNVSMRLSIYNPEPPKEDLQKFE